MFWIVLWSLFAAPTDASAPAVLAKVRAGVLDNLSRLPNCTCTQVIERSYRRGAKRPFENVDRVRLEVGYIDGKELFGWPGGERLGEKDLDRLVGGTITYGEFALAIRALFAGRSVAFGDMWEETYAGRAAHRFEFTVPREGTDWILGIGGRFTPIGYHGSFWVDSDSLQLVELRITADDVPAELGYKAVTRDLQFQSVRIGTGEFLLPSRAEFSATERGGAENRNETRFHDCRQYAAERVVSFGPSATGAPGDAHAPRPAAAATLPEEFEASLTLDTPIDSDTSAIGDPITASLQRSIKRENETVVPKGAVLHGRITRLDMTGGRRYADLGFTYFEVDGGRIEVGGRINELVALTRYVSNWQLISAAGPIRASGRHLVLARGFPFFLKSAAAGKTQSKAQPNEPAWLRESYDQIMKEGRR